MNDLLEVMGKIGYGDDDPNNICYPLTGYDLNRSKQKVIVDASLKDVKNNTIVGRIRQIFKR